MVRTNREFVAASSPIRAARARAINDPMRNIGAQSTRQGGKAQLIARHFQFREWPYYIRIVLICKRESFLLASNHSKRL
jgi:hypothetical protein